MRKSIRATTLRTRRGVHNTLRHIARARPKQHMAVAIGCIRKGTRFGLNGAPARSAYHVPSTWGCVRHLATVSLHTYLRPPPGSRTPLGLVAMIDWATTQPHACPCAGVTRAIIVCPPCTQYALTLRNWLERHGDKNQNMDYAEPGCSHLNLDRQTATVCHNHMHEHRYVITCWTVAPLLHGRGDALAVHVAPGSALTD